MFVRMFALQRMKEAGAHLTTSESAILGLCEGSDHPNFREIQKIIWDAAPDSGLLGHTTGGETPVWQMYIYIHVYTHGTLTR